MTSRRVTVTGRVQGVGFRWFVRAAAETAGVSGWVRNRRDGAVVAELHGSADAVSQVTAAMRRGPHNARVEQLTIEELPETDAAGFDILSTS